MRDFDRLYRENRQEFDKIVRNLAAERARTIEPRVPTFRLD